MDTCVLFVRDINEQGCLCLKLDDNNEVITAPQVRDFAEIKSLQDGAKTLIIESSLNAHILELELPWLPERKARTALPYALEEKLAQPVEDLHFCFDKAHYRNGRYEVFIIAKSRMFFITHLLAEHDIDFDTFTLDWFALQPTELCASDYGILINSEDHKGALAGELANLYHTKHPKQPCIRFSDSVTKLYNKIPKSDEPFAIWAAKRLINNSAMNLCQGEFQHNNSLDWIKKGYTISGALFALWLISLILMNSISLYRINKQTAVIDEKTATIYHQFFPDAKQIISPKFRITELLKGHDAGQQNQLLRLLNQFSQAYPKQGIVVKELRYQNQSLSITMVCSDFPMLQALENKLKSLSLKLKQTEASTQEGRVYATLEIS